MACTGVCGTSETTWPSRMTSTREAKAAMSGSWVTSTMVMPARDSRWNSAMISTLVRVSRLPVGSSARRMRGPVDQRAGDGHPLLLAARQLAGLVVQPLAQAHAGQRLGRRAGAARARATPA